MKLLLLFSCILVSFVGTNNAESPVQLSTIESTHNIMKRNATYSNQTETKPSSPSAYMATPNPSNYSTPEYSYPVCNKTEDCNKCELNSGNCTKDVHLTGCTLQDCTENDTLLINYSCYCTNSLEPHGCVFTDIGEPPCEDEFHGIFCQCNGPRKSPTWCSLRTCNPGEQTSATTTCVCGETKDTQPCGCIKESTQASAQAIENDIVFNDGRRMGMRKDAIVVVA